eukprot:COSAG01_NODE_2527_length_7500_cov_4.494393_7_plen_516_part_00
MGSHAVAAGLLVVSWGIGVTAFPLACAWAHHRRRRHLRDGDRTSTSSRRGLRPLLTATRPAASPGDHAGAHTLRRHPRYPQCDHCRRSWSVQLAALALVVVGASVLYPLQHSLVVAVVSLELPEDRRASAMRAELYHQAAVHASSALAALLSAGAAVSAPPEGGPGPWYLGTLPAWLGLACEAAATLLAHLAAGGLTVGVCSALLLGCGRALIATAVLVLLVTRVAEQHRAAARTMMTTTTTTAAHRHHFSSSSPAPPAAAAAATAADCDQLPPPRWGLTVGVLLGSRALAYVVGELLWRDWLRSLPSVSCVRLGGESPGAPLPITQCTIAVECLCGGLRSDAAAVLAAACLGAAGLGLGLYLCTACCAGPSPSHRPLSPSLLPRSSSSTDDVCAHPSDDARADAGLRADRSHLSLAASMPSAGGEVAVASERRAGSTRPPPTGRRPTMTTMRFGIHTGERAAVRSRHFHYRHAGVRVGHDYTAWLDDLSWTDVLTFLATRPRGGGGGRPASCRS